jgi:hypothetical protein
MIGLVLAFHVFQSYRAQAASGEKQFWQLVGAAALSATTLGFGIHSFWKSRNLH